MGTKVHCANYLLGYAMRDLNEDVDRCWYNAKTSGRNLYSGYQIPSNGYLEYDKEMVKRTMLEHEAIFRKQVYELHRLYRIQHDMMEELNKGKCLGANSSLSNSLLSQIPSEGTSRMFQTAYLSETTVRDIRAPLTVTNDKKPTINFLIEGSMHSGPVSTGKEIAQEDVDLLDSPKVVPKRMFDLQLPGDAYIECEERSAKVVVADSSSVTTVPFDRNQGADVESCVKLTLGVADGPNYRAERKLDIKNQSDPTTCSMGDINVPAREICFDKAAETASTTLLGPRTPLAENQRLRSQGRPTNFLGMEGGHFGEGTSSNHLHVDDDETSREWPFLNNQYGQSTSNAKIFSPGFSKEKIFMPTEQPQWNSKSHEILLLDHSKRETSLKPKLEFSGSSSQYGHTTAPFPTTFSNVFLDRNSAVSPLLPSWTKLTNDCNLPPLQLSQETAAWNHVIPSDKWQYRCDSRSHLGVDIDPNHYQNDFNHVVKLDHGAASPLYTPPITSGKRNFGGRNDGNLEGYGPQWSQKDAHLNQIPLNGYRNGLNTQMISKPAKKCEYASGALSWFRKKPSCDAPPLMELDLSQGYPQLKSTCSVMNQRCETLETGNGINLFNLQGSSSSNEAKETTVKMNVASCGQSGKRLFGFPIPEKTQETVLNKNDEMDKLKLPSMEMEILIEGLVTKSSDTSNKNHAKLNLDLNLLDLSAECEMLEVTVSAPTVASGINLEAPDVSEENLQDDAVVKEAAENILLISSDKCSHFQPAVSHTTLHWLAEVISSHVETAIEISNDELDSFELMTLKMEETKPEEFWCRSLDRQDQKNDDEDEEEGKSTVASLLFTKPRRGQQRKRRQKRDFQKDILPGLASLSRHEVTEDIQTFGALMKASGQSWQSGGTTRRTGRVGRRPRSLAVAVEDIQVHPPQPPPPPQPEVVPLCANTTEVEADGRSMIVWGRTTRRCRRQRCPPVTNVAAPTT